MKNLARLVLALVVAFSSTVQAQDYFGKNNVMWEKQRKNFYRSAHYDVIDYLDHTDPNQLDRLNDLINTLESGYEYMSKGFGFSLKERPTLIVYRTHSMLAGSPITQGQELPETVGAFVDEQNRMVLKEDLLPMLERHTRIHELTHIFQFASFGDTPVLKDIRSRQVPGWVMEGFAEYAAYAYTGRNSRDDFREMKRRLSSANPELYLPTLEQLQNNQADIYGTGCMLFEFIAAKFGNDAAWTLELKTLKSPGKLMETIVNISQGTVARPETLDRKEREYFKELYAEKLLHSQKFNDKTESYLSRQISHLDPYPMGSPALSPDGKKVAYLSYDPNLGTALKVGPALPREQAPYDPKKKNRIPVFGEKDPNASVILNHYRPPKHFEYIVSQITETWPFNGSDIDWSPDGKKIAFFAKKNRDHALFVVNAENGKILNEVRVALDQAFSPAFGPGGNTVYFAASKNLNRDIYAVNLNTSAVMNLTSDTAFDSAPAVSPDGRFLVYVKQVGAYQKLFVLDLGTGVKVDLASGLLKTQLTFGQWNDNSPSFSSDGTKLVFTSDKEDSVWNVYTMDSATHTVSQWTNWFTGGFTPKFVPGENDRLVVAALNPYAQYHSYIYPNQELYDLRLSNPLGVVPTLAVGDDPKDYAVSFRPEEAFKGKLDENQLFNPEKAPEKWRFQSSRGVVGGTTGGYGTYIYSYGEGRYQNVLNTKIHYFGFGLSGVSVRNSYRYLDYAYVNLENRRAWGIQAFDHKYPLYYSYYDFSKGKPKDLNGNDQFVLNNTDGEELGVGLIGQYPFNKFNRFEFGVQPRKRIFNTYLDDEIVDVYHDFFTPQDLAFYNFFKRASGQTSVSFSGALVHDTTFFSYGTMGPWFGSRARLDVQVAPSVAGLTGYASATFDGRKYLPLGRSGLLAFRGVGMTSSRPNGDFLLLGGNDVLSSYPYGSIPGNQIAFGRVELRIPLVDAVIFPGRLGFGPFRGMLFADYGVAKFNGASLSQKAASYGFGVQLHAFFVPVNFVWAKTKMDNFHQLKYNFYIGYSF